MRRFRSDATVGELREANLTPILIRLVHDEMAIPLAQQVVHAIAAEIPAVVLPPSTEPTLWELFDDPALGLTNSGRHPVLIFDQFEEL